MGAGTDAQRVQALEELGILGTPPEERFDRITTIARSLFGVDSALVSLIAQDHQWIKSPQLPGATTGPRTDALCDEAIRSPDTLVVPDARVDPRFADNPYVTGEYGLRFYAGHPIEAPGGFRVGTLCLVGQRPRTFSATERDKLQQLARWVEQELQDHVELDRAAEVHRGLHPHATSMSVPGYDLAGICLPSRTVGGDLLDWYRTDDGDVAVTLGDVMGKGMGAAIMMAGLRAAMRTAGRTQAPTAALAATAATLDEDLQETGTLVTLHHVRLTPASGAVVGVDAGHGLSVLVRADGTTAPPPPNGLPLGVLPDGGWADQHQVLEPGDTLASFTDGLLDLHDGTAATVIGELTRIVRASADARTVVDHVAALARRSLLTDDVTMFALHRSATGGS